ncbi:MAG: hypothetical protein JSS69_10570 [Acidobacteria bacterium]|nr:hypothetical protein [Acidobacteriota bacterium]MBS1866345.1 hypothetical protein [Acidobacteriota bacterium]
MSKRDRRNKYGNLRKGKKLKGQNSPNDHHNPRSNQPISGDIRVNGSLEVRETEGANAKHNTERNEDDGYKKHTKWFESRTVLLAILTFFISAAYFITTFFIFVQSKRSADIADKTVTQASERFQIEQRPIIWTPNKIASPAYLIKAKRIVWDWYFTNYGKTPAKEIRMYEYFRIRKGEWQRPPSDRAHDYSFGAPLPPGKEDFKTMVTTDIEAADAKKILTEDFGISMKIRITYKDAFGNSYESQVCFVHLATGATTYCSPEEAYIDSPVTAPR